MTPDPVQHLIDVACEGVAHCEEIEVAVARGDAAEALERCRHLHALLVPAIAGAMRRRPPHTHTPDHRRAA